MPPDICEATCLNGQACTHRAREGRNYCGKHINAQRRAERVAAATAAVAAAAEERARARTAATLERIRREAAEAVLDRYGGAAAGVGEGEAVRAAGGLWGATVAARAAWERGEGRGATARERRTLNRVALPLTSSEKSVKAKCEECDNTCPICMDEMVGEKVVCSNGHAVCEKHIIQSITANKGLGDSVLKCSVCRTQILTSQVSYACNALLDVVCNKSQTWNRSDWNMIENAVKNSDKTRVVC